MASKSDIVEKVIDIANVLKLDVAHNHISNILDKTGANNRVELVRWALQWGKVCLDEVNCCTLPIHSDRIS